MGLIIANICGAIRRRKQTLVFEQTTTLVAKRVSGLGEKGVRTRCNYKQSQTRNGITCYQRKVNRRIARISWCDYINSCQI